MQSDEESDQTGIEPIKKCPFCGSKEYHKCQNRYVCDECHKNWTDNEDETKSKILPPSKDGGF